MPSQQLPDGTIKTHLKTNVFTSDTGMLDTAGFTCFLLATNLIERNFGTSPGDEMIRNESVASAHCIMRFAFEQMDFYAHCPVFKRPSNYKKPENLVHLT